MSKSRLFVFQLKEIIYTLIFVILTIILVIVLINMFGNKSDSRKLKETSNFEISYNPGIYSTPVKLNNSDINVEVAVDSKKIKSISLTNLSDTVETMYPLLEPSIDYIETQLVEGKDIKEVELDSSNQYTQTILLKAVSTCLDKASKTTEGNSF